MEKIEKAGTLKTPEIIFDYEMGVIDFKGRSTPENTETFYRPLLEWAKNYVGAPKEKTTININFEYFNSSTAKYLVRFLEIFDPLFSQQKDVQINWFFEDDETLEAGKDFADVLGYEFSFVFIEN